MHPVEDVGISPWPVDVFEFGADAYAHRNQVDVKQLYNQVPQTDWVSSVQVVVAVGVAVPVGIRCRSESQLQTEGLGPQDPGWEAKQNKEEVLLRSEELGVNMWQSVPSPTHLSHITNINPFATLSRIKCERYIFYKEVCSFVIIVDYVSEYIYIRIVVYNIISIKIHLWNKKKL